MAGVEGPILFVCVATDQMKSHKQGDLSRHGLPKVPHGIGTPTTYLTDNTWLRFIPKIFVGILALEGIKDHDN